MPQVSMTAASVACYEVSVSIQSSKARVWRGLTDQLNAWWLPDFHMLGTDSIVTLELKPGGRMYEETEGSGLLWYTVLAFEVEKSLDVVGFCTPQWGGPATSMLSFRLADDGNGTLLTMTDALSGHVSQKQIDSLHSGWTDLLSAGLKSYLEQ
jgi:hypothetical protein